MTLTDESTCDCPIQQSPYLKAHHTHQILKPRPKIANNILECIGNTPLVRLNSVGKKDGIECEILVKCEFFNPGGSIKDRIADRMISAAEEEGQILAGDQIIEATSGNTGIGLALASAVKNYSCTIVLPEKMSMEKINMLKALGANIIRTRTSANFDDPDSHIEIAKKIQSKNPKHIHLLDQYKNINNPLAHYDKTAQEIIQDCRDKLPDMVVISAGTGGTLTGISKGLKKANPKCIVVGVDPAGSILARNKVEDEKKRKVAGSYDIEGIGYDFIPNVLDDHEVDFWVKSYDKESFELSRRLIREEGLFCGGSCGSAMYGALFAMKKLNWGSDKRVVVILPDSVRNYMTKFLLDDWMVSKGHMDLPCNDELATKMSKLNIGKENALKLKKPKTFKPDMTIDEFLKAMKKDGISLNSGVGLVTEDGEWGPNAKVLGVIDAKKITKAILMDLAQLYSPLSQVMNKEYRSASHEHHMEDVMRVIILETYCLLTMPDGPYIINDDDFLNTLI